IKEKEGYPTYSDNCVKDGDALLPLGGDREHGSHKGYALVAIVDILSAVLSGANYGPWVPPFVAFLQPDPNPVGEGIGHFFGAMRVDAFRPAEDFKENMDIWIERFRSAKTTPGHEKVLIPGDPERELEAERRAFGIPLIKAVEEDLRNLGDKLGVAF